MREFDNAPYLKHGCFQMTQLRLMAMILNIMEDCNAVQYNEFSKMIQNFSKSLEFAGDFDFTIEELNMLQPEQMDPKRMSGKIQMIKARRERTGEALTTVVKAAQILFKSNGWTW